MTYQLLNRVARLTRSFRRPRRGPATRPAVQPEVLPLEDRTMPSTLTVCNLGDGDTTSLPDPGFGPRTPGQGS
jgi:hypothetical protein